ncbi:MAG: hypothetical protein HWE23_01075 [Rhodobacteraceae bacterium]|nr:hypothetical protein [Paracoccaceae bacterium]
MYLFAPLLLVFGAFFLVPEAEARIYCPLPEQGTWINKSAKPKELSRLEIETRCRDDRVFARIRAYTKCIPRDCKWGWTDAAMRSEGKGLEVLLRGFYLSKFISVTANGDQISAYVSNDYHDEKMQDTVKNFILYRD